MTALVSNTVEASGCGRLSSHIRDERLESSTVVNLVIFQGQMSLTPCSALVSDTHDGA